MSSIYVPREKHQCSGVARSTGKPCRENAFSTYGGKYYCGNHYPTNPETKQYLLDPTEGGQITEELREQIARIVWESKSPITNWDSDALPEYVRNGQRYTAKKIISLFTMSVKEVK